jgi:PAS domain S-box-containing protein
MIFERFAEALKTGYSRGEMVHQLLDGTPIPCEVTLVRVPRGNSYGICGYLRDMREQKAMLAQINEANERIKMMLDATPLGCQIWDENFDIIDCNTAVVNMFGLKDKQEYIDRFFELVPGLDGQNSMEAAFGRIRMALETGYQRFEVMQQLSDGTPLPCEITLVRIPRDKGYMICGYSRDLREQKKYEAEQQRDQQRMNALLELAQMTQHSEQDIIDYTIQSAASLTNSTVGYVIQLDHTSASAPFRSLHIDQSDFCSLPVVTEEIRPSHRDIPLVAIRSCRGVA